MKIITVRIGLSACCLVLCVGALAFGIGGDGPVQDKAPLKLWIMSTGETLDDIAIKVIFENTETDDVTILREFDHREIFFSFHLRKADGTPLIQGLGGGKISFDRQVRYATLRPGELFGVNILLKHVMGSLADGNYTLSVTYHNQYGEKCFQGTLDSNTIPITVGGSATTKPAAPELMQVQELKILETVLQSDGTAGCEIMNSRVRVDTSGIRQLRKDGVKALPALVSLLGRDELSFDTFVRCYSAAEQVLTDAKPDIEIGWQGGAQMTKADHGTFRLEPGGQASIPEFRRDIAAQVARAWRTLQHDRTM